MSSPATNEKMQQLIASEEICRLIHDYAFHLDMNHPTELSNLFVEDCDAAYERAVRAGVATVLPPADMPYGERSATVSDGFGNLWFIATVLAAS